MAIYVRKNGGGEERERGKKTAPKYDNIQNVILCVTDEKEQQQQEDEDDERDLYCSWLMMLL